MRIDKKFAPITITLETEEDKDFFMKMIQRVLKSEEAWYFSRHNKSSFYEKVVSFERVIR